jgi:hypothetical protein
MKQFTKIEKQEVKIAFDLFESMKETFNLSDDELINNLINRINTTETYENDEYKVVVKQDKLNAEGREGTIGEIVWLSICRLDREPLHNWRDLQTIKNMLVGEECFGYEVYPAESQLVDTANQYHLWCLPNGTHLPFGFHEGRKVNYNSTSVTKQEPLKTI